MKKISYFNCHKQKNFHDFLEMKALRRRASKRDTSAGVKRSVDLSLPSISWKVHHCISICLPLSTLRFCVYIDIQPLHNQQNIGPCLSDMVSPSLTVQSVWSWKAIVQPSVTARYGLKWYNSKIQRKIQNKKWESLLNKKFGEVWRSEFPSNHQQSSFALSLCPDLEDAPGPALCITAWVVSLAVSSCLGIGFVSGTALQKQELQLRMLRCTCTLEIWQETGENEKMDTK